MNTDTGELSPFATEPPKAKRQSLSREQHEHLTPMSKTERLAWLASLRQAKAPMVVPKAPSQQGRSQWPNHGRARARRNAQRRRTHDGPEG